MLDLLDTHFQLTENRNAGAKSSPCEPALLNPLPNEGAARDCLAQMVSVEEKSVQGIPISRRAFSLDSFSTSSRAAKNRSCSSAGIRAAASSISRDQAAISSGSTGGSPSSMRSSCPSDQDCGRSSNG